MFVIAKKSKFEKLDNSLFNVAIVSRDITSSSGGAATHITGLYPPAELASKMEDMGKKKFAKKYIEYLKTDVAQIELYNIILAVKSNKLGFIFVCSDDEWDCGYLQILGQYLVDTFGYTVFGVKEAAKVIKEEYSSLSKKEKKNKKTMKKFKKSLLKKFKKEYMSATAKGDKLIGQMHKKFALDRVLFTAIQEGYMNYDGNSASPAGDDKLAKFKTSVVFTAMEAVSSSKKKYKKIIKEVLESHDMKLNKKSFKKLDKVQTLLLLAEAANLVNASRYDDDK